MRMRRQITWKYEARDDDEFVLCEVGGFDTWAHIELARAIVRTQPREDRAMLLAETMTTLIEWEDMPVVDGDGRLASMIEAVEKYVNYRNKR